LRETLESHDAWSTFFFSSFRFLTQAPDPHYLPIALDLGYHFVLLVSALAHCTNSTQTLADVDANKMDGLRSIASRIVLWSPRCQFLGIWRARRTVSGIIEKNVDVHGIGCQSSDTDVSTLQYQSTRDSQSSHALLYERFNDPS